MAKDSEVAEYVSAKNLLLDYLGTGSCIWIMLSCAALNDWQGPLAYIMYFDK